MKKFKKIAALVLSVGMVAGGAVLSACSNNGEGDDGLTPDQIESIIKDEETWDKAFEDMDYANFSAHVSYQTSEEGEALNNYVEVTENGVHYKLDGGVEFYSIKNEDDTYSTYIKYYSEYTNQNKFVLLNDKSDTYFAGAKNETVIKVSYASYFDLFKYNKETNSYYYEGDIDVEAKDFDGQPLATISCFDITIKVSNNKIISVKSSYRIKDTEQATEDVQIMNTTWEYYDIGTTTVTVPQEVIDEATANT